MFRPFGLGYYAWVVFVPCGCGGFRGLGLFWVGFDFWLIGHGLPGSWLVSAWVGCGVGFWLWRGGVVLGVGLLVC